LVYDFLRVEDEKPRGLIRSKDGDWLEQGFTEFPTAEFQKTYSDLTNLTGFFDLYGRYVLKKPSGDVLRHA
jgi:hypothetical protein